jgi:hypothetical protein
VKQPHQAAKRTIGSAPRAYARSGTRAGRDHLLADLPPALLDRLTRSETKLPDLGANLDGAAAWPVVEEPTPL